MSAALLLIDLQNDFCAGGALAVPHADDVIAVANRLMPQFNTVIATQDWHPAGHHSFASTHAKQPFDCITLNQHEQILWPDHCVQYTQGAEFHPALNTSLITHIIQKGTDLHIDSYSAFYDNHRLKKTGLTDWLTQHGISNLWVMGLATDYCVKYSCLDAIADGFSVSVILEGCRGVNLQAGDVDKAIIEMKQNHIGIVA